LRSPTGGWKETVPPGVVDQAVEVVLVHGVDAGSAFAGEQEWELNVSHSSNDEHGIPAVGAMPERGGRIG